ncbi:ArsR/SmtB family transcription factor [Myxococcus landrumensis]|uniref:Winged helix-turn-helix transcriptional regulator n=1 Tax=Myxococcus landrumensis TaxID=2813577 RepID=A0ABX7N3B6_9BACT|nr:metalloregulator ArsR/SmtB family transcription factor [Myxococcus landrumus]QSQ12988.1 winged helix-turn-helix transcriptional regulator [Myxococcus landrumus]
MVELLATRLDNTFHALADPTRRAMLRSLTVQERSVGELAAPFEMSLAAASKHIKVLEKAGLVRREVKGRMHVCRLEAKPLSDVRDWLRFYERFWGERIDTLEALLRADAPTPPAAPRGKGRSR